MRKYIILHAALVVLVLGIAGLWVEVFTGNVGADLTPAIPNSGALGRIKTILRVWETNAVSETQIADGTLSPSFATVTASGDINANGNIVGDTATDIVGIDEIVADNGITSSNGMVITDGNALQVLSGDNTTSFFLGNFAPSLASFTIASNAATQAAGVLSINASGQIGVGSVIAPTVALDVGGGLQVSGLSALTNITASGTFIVTGATTLDGTTVIDDTLTVTGRLVVATIANVTPLAVTSTDALELVNTRSLQFLQASGDPTVTNTLANPSAIGDELEIWNVGSSNIFILDTANIEGAGDVTLGQFDVIKFRAQTTGIWMEQYRNLSN